MGAVFLPGVWNNSDLSPQARLCVPGWKSEDVEKVTAAPVNDITHKRWSVSPELLWWQRPSNELVKTESQCPITKHTNYHQLLWKRLGNTQRTSSQCVCITGCNCWRRHQTVVQWLALLPHNKKVLASRIFPRNEKDPLGVDVSCLCLYTFSYLTNRSCAGVAPVCRKTLCAG